MPLYQVLDFENDAVRVKAWPMVGRSVQSQNGDLCRSVLRCPVGEETRVEYKDITGIVLHVKGEAKEDFDVPIEALWRTCGQSNDSRLCATIAVPVDGATIAVPVDGAASVPVVASPVVASAPEEQEGDALVHRVGGFACQGNHACVPPPTGGVQERCTVCDDDVSTLGAWCATCTWALCETCVGARGVAKAYVPVIGACEEFEDPTWDPHSSYTWDPYASKLLACGEGDASFFCALKGALYAHEAQLTESLIEGEDSALDVREALLSCHQVHQPMTTLYRVEDHDGIKMGAKERWRMEREMCARAAQVFGVRVLVIADTSALHNPRRRPQGLDVVACTVLVEGGVQCGGNGCVLLTTAPVVVIVRCMGQIGDVHYMGMLGAAIRANSAHVDGTTAWALAARDLEVARNQALDEQPEIQGRAAFEMMGRVYAYGEATTVGKALWLAFAERFTKSATHPTTSSTTSPATARVPDPRGASPLAMRTPRWGARRGSPESARMRSWKTETGITIPDVHSMRDAKTFLTLQATEYQKRVLFQAPRVGEKNLNRTQKQQKRAAWRKEVLDQVYSKECHTKAGVAVAPDCRPKCVIARCTHVLSQQCKYVCVMRAPNQTEVDNGATLWSTALAAKHTCKDHIVTSLPTPKDRHPLQCPVGLPGIPSLGIPLARVDSNAISIHAIVEIVKDSCVHDSVMDTAKARAKATVAQGFTAVANALGSKVRESVPVQTMQRAIRIVKQATPATVQEDVQRLPHVVRGLRELGHYASCTYSPREGAQQVFVDSVKATVLRNNLRAKKVKREQDVVEWDESSLEIPSTLRMPGCFYYAWAYAPKHTIHMVKNGLLDPIAALDGTHSLRAVKMGGGTLLLMYGQDVNHRQVLMLACHVLGNECIDSWLFFFHHLRAAYGDALVRDEWVTIVDGLKGIEIAFYETFGPCDGNYEDDDFENKHMSLFRCVKHRGENVQTNYRHVGTQAYKYAVRSATEVELRKRKGYYDEVPKNRKGELFKEYMGELYDHMQYPFAHKACHRRSLHGRTNQSGVEAMNNACKGARAMPIATMLACVVEDERGRAMRAQRDALRAVDALEAIPPSVRREIYGTVSVERSKHWKDNTRMKETDMFKLCSLRRTMHPTAYKYDTSAHASHGTVIVHRERAKYGTLEVDEHTKAHEVDLYDKKCSCEHLGRMQGRGVRRGERGGGTRATP